MNNKRIEPPPSITTVVPAAGVGKRMAADIPKQYLPFAGKTVLEHTLARLRTHPAISDIVLVVSAEDEFITALPCYQQSWLKVVIGGKERSDSVLNGVKHAHSDWVLVHDAARPCVRIQDIDTLLQLSYCAHGGILARQATDTMKLANLDCSTKVDQSVPRQQLWHALTPQLFPAQALRDALQYCVQQSIAITDEASAIEAVGGVVNLVPGEPDNIKITQPGDLALAEFYLQQQHNEASFANT